MAARKSWLHRLESTLTAVRRLGEKFRNDRAANLNALLPPLDYSTATAEEMAARRKLEERLERQGLLLFGRPCSLIPVMTIVPAGHAGWLDLAASPVPTRRFRRALTLSFEEWNEPPKGIERSLPLVCQSPVFRVRSPAAAAERPGMSSGDARLAQFSYYGDPSALDAVRRAAEMVVDAHATVPAGRRSENGEGNLEFYGPSWTSAAAMDRVTAVLMDIGWRKTKAKDGLVTHRMAFFEGQEEIIPCDCDDLSEASVTDVLLRARREDVLGIVTVRGSPVRPPPVPGGAWRITQSLLLDLLPTLEFLLLRWRSEPVPPEDLISQAEAGKLAGVHAKTIRAWLDEGRIQGYGPKRRVSRAEIAPLGPGLRRRAARSKTGDEKKSRSP
ncbi:MAG: hypothetical protein GIKADHBN_00435 [Phycisphaerales bacterium]|nr:hypothetical protein [Phycisphaerales bacterium]